MSAVLVIMAPVRIPVEVSERGVDRMAVRLYVGWGARSGSSAWAGLSEEERDSWRNAARDLLRSAFEETR